MTHIYLQKGFSCNCPFENFLTPNVRFNNLVSLFKSYMTFFFFYATDVVILDNYKKFMIHADASKASEACQVIIVAVIITFFRISARK